jgi:pyrimidine-nucleoside phosphorylase
MAFGEVMLDLARVEGGRERLQKAIDSGDALQKLIDVTIAQGGDPRVLEDTSLLAVAQYEAVLEAQTDGFVTTCDALTIGMAATRLGAGRTSKKDMIDPGVGITIHAKVGDEVSAGDPLATVRYSDEERWEDRREGLASAWVIGPSPEAPRPLILEKVTADSVGL